MDNGVRFTIQVDGNQQANGAIQGVATNLNKLAGIANQIRRISLSALVDNVRNVSQALGDLNAPAISFNQSIADLSAITGIAGADLQNLEKASRQVGKASGLGATQAAEAFKLLASAIDINNLGGVEGLKLLQKETITLAQAAGVDLPTAANTMASTINQFKLPATEASRVINTLAAAAKYGAAEVPDLAESLRFAGPVAGAAGVSIEQVAGALEVLSQSAIKGSDAGTDLSGIMVRMQSVLGIDIGKVGLPAALQMLKPRLNDVTYLSKVFGQENLKSIQTLIGNADAVGTMTDRVTGTKVAYEQAIIRTDTYQHRVELAKARMDDFKISLAESTGGLSIWAGMLAQPAVTISQLMPLITSLKGGIGFLTKTQNLNTIATGASSFAMKLFSRAALQSVIPACRAIGVAIMNIPIIGWIAATIAGLIFLFKYLWSNSEKFREKMSGAWGGLKAIFHNIGVVFTFLWDKVFKPILNLYMKGVHFVVDAWKWGFAIIGDLFKKLLEFPGKLLDFIKDKFPKIAALVSKIFEPIVKLWNKIFPKDKFTDISDAARAESDKNEKNFQARRNADNEEGLFAGLGATPLLGALATSGDRYPSGQVGNGAIARSMVINIGTLGAITLHTTTIKEGAQEIRRIITQEIMAAVNDVNLAVN